MSFRQRRKRVIWSHRGRGARRNARCFFLLRAPLHLPQAARRSEPVNSRCGCVWQGRRFGSASKVKKSRKTNVFLLFLAPPVGLKPTTLSVRNIVALLAWGARNARCFFLLRAPLHLPQAARRSEPVNSRCGCVWQGRRFGSVGKVKKEQED